MPAFFSLKKRNQGQSLLEIIIAMAIFALITTAVASLILGSLSLTNEGGKYSQADMLSQEGIEAVMAIKNRAWNELEYTQSAISFSSGRWEFAGEGTSEQIAAFSRTISFFPVYRDAQNNIVASTAPGSRPDKQSKGLSVSVSWQTGRGFSNSVDRSLYLTNWDSFSWSQTDWSEGSGQDIFYAEDKYYADDNNIDFSISGELSLKEISTSTYAVQGYIISSAFDIGEGSAPSLIFADWEKPADCHACEVKIQIKSAPDNGGLPGIWTNTWSGEDGIDGDETDYYAATSSGVIVNTAHNEDQWFRYKAILYGEAENTPRLKKIIIDYKQ